MRARLRGKLAGFSGRFGVENLSSSQALPVAGPDGGFQRFFIGHFWRAAPGFSEPVVFKDRRQGWLF